MRSVAECYGALRGATWGQHVIIETRYVNILYTNHRGETRWRRILPYCTYWGATEWHPAEQWLLRADDLEDGRNKDFAMAGIKGWRTDDGGAECAP